MKLIESLFLLTWTNLQRRSMGRLYMNGIISVETPVRKRTRDIKLSFFWLVVRCLVKILLVKRLPSKNPENPSVQTRLIVCVSVLRL